MGTNHQLRLLSTLSGQFTEGRLRKIGFDYAVIRRAISVGLFETVNGNGVLSSIKHNLRSLKIRAALLEAAPLAQGQTVQRVVDGKLVTYQVVSVSGDKLVLIDPANPDAGSEEVDAKEVSQPDPSNTNQPGTDAETEAAPPTAAPVPEKVPFV